MQIMFTNGNYYHYYRSPALKDAFPMGAGLNFGNELQLKKRSDMLFAFALVYAGCTALCLAMLWHPAPWAQVMPSRLCGRGGRYE